MIKGLNEILDKTCLELGFSREDPFINSLFYSENITNIKKSIDNPADENNTFYVLCENNLTKMCKYENALTERQKNFLILFVNNFSKNVITYLNQDNNLKKNKMNLTNLVERIVKTIVESDLFVFCNNKIKKDLLNFISNSDNGNYHYKNPYIYFNTHYREDEIGLSKYVLTSSIEIMSEIENSNVIKEISNNQIVSLKNEIISFYKNYFLDLAEDYSKDNNYPQKCLKVYSFLVNLDLMHVDIASYPSVEYMNKIKEYNFFEKIYEKYQFAYVNNELKEKLLYIDNDNDLPEQYNLWIGENKTSMFLLELREMLYYFGKNELNEDLGIKDVKVSIEKNVFQLSYNISESHKEYGIGKILAKAVCDEFNKYKNKPLTTRYYTITDLIQQEIRTRVLNKELERNNSKKKTEEKNKRKV